MGDFKLRTRSIHETKVISVSCSSLVLALLRGFIRNGFYASFFELPDNIDLNNDYGKDMIFKNFKFYEPDVLLLNGDCISYYQELKYLCRNNNAYLIYWASEDPLLFAHTLDICKEADLILTPSLECCNKYKELGLNAEFFMFACDPGQHYYGKHDSELNLDLTVIDSCYAWPWYNNTLVSAIGLANKREVTLGLWEIIWDNNLNTKNLLQGRTLPYYRGYLDNYKIPDLCASTKIILGIYNDYTSIVQTGMLPYEVLGCRGFYLTEHSPVLESVFDNEKHLVFIKSPEETIEKARFYLNKPDLRGKIAFEGQKHVYKEHTYEKRVKDFILPYLKKHFNLR